MNTTILSNNLQNLNQLDEFTMDKSTIKSTTWRKINEHTVFETVKTTTENFTNNLKY